MNGWRFNLAAVVLSCCVLGGIPFQAQAFKLGVSAGYSSIGFDLHGWEVDLMANFGKGKGRPSGSGLRLGLGVVAGSSTSDLTKAKWNGQTYEQYQQSAEAAITARIRTEIEAGIEAAIPAAIAAAIPGSITQLQQGYQAVQALGATAVAIFARDTGCAATPTSFDVAACAVTQVTPEVTRAVTSAVTPEVTRAVTSEVNRQAINGYAAYGIPTTSAGPDFTNVQGNAVAALFSVAYEYVLSRGAPGLGFLAGAEIVYIEGTQSSSGDKAVYPDAKTTGGLGGGAVLGVSYYLKNGINFTVKSGLGVIDPGELTLLGVKVEPETTFYASPAFLFGYMWGY